MSRPEKGFYAAQYHSALAREVHRTVTGRLLCGGVRYGEPAEFRIKLVSLSNLSATGHTEIDGPKQKFGGKYCHNNDAAEN
jgi:hypothetical protein